MMKNVKTWATLATCVAATITGLARGETTPVLADASANPNTRPLMWGLDQLGLAKPLNDWGITIGGFGEASTTFYADRADSKFQPGRGFDSEDQDPTINQIDLFVNRDVVVSGDKWDVGGRIEWIYGADARFIHSTGLFDNNGPADGPNEQFDPVQLYVDVAIPVGNGLKVRVGKFVTPAGMETIDPTATWGSGQAASSMYTRGFLFTYMLPFTHTGIYATYKLNDQWSFSGGVIRGWDDALEDKNADGVSIIGGATWTIDPKQSLALTVIVGPEYAGDTTHYRSLVDAVYKYQLADNIFVGGQGDLIWETDEDGKGPSTDDGFAFGAGGFVTWRPGGNKYVAVNGRAEYLYDGDGLRVAPGLANNYYSIAAGLDIQPFADNTIGSNLHLRPEVRYDYAQNAIFGGNDNNQWTLGLEGYFTF